MFRFFEGKPEEPKRPGFGFDKQAVPGPDNDLTYDESMKIDVGKLTPDEIDRLLTEMERELAEDPDKVDMTRLQYLRALRRSRNTQ